MLLNKLYKKNTRKFVTDLQLKYHIPWGETIHTITKIWNKPLAE